VKRILVLLVFLGLLTCLCAASAAVGLRALAATSGAELPDDGPQIATSAEAACRLVEMVTASGQSAVETGQLTLTVTEEEVTSFLNIGSEVTGNLQGLENFEELTQLGDLEEVEGLQGLEQWQELLRMREAQGLPSIRLSDLSPRLGIKEPQVYFKDSGHIVVRGYAGLLRWRWPVRVVVAPRASQGEMVLDFVEGTLGSVDMPEVIFDLIGKGLAQAILAGQEYAEITEIGVGAGTLTISGRYRK
jgi:hypothetical protein